MTDRLGSILTPRLGTLWLAAGPQTKADGRVERRFRKELIRTGHYVKDEDGIEFEVTPHTLAHFVEQFERMKANGVRVPVPNGHHNAGNADANRGYVEELFVEGDTLVGVLRMVGDDGIAAAQRSDVSIYVPIDFTDGKGNKYTRPIEHVALCTDPVVPGLGEFIPLAASKEAVVNKLEFAKKLAKTLKLAKELTEENAEELLTAGITELIEARDKAAADLKAKEEEATEAKAEAEQLKVAASRKADPLMVKLAADNAKLKLDGLVAASRLTPAARDKLAAALLGKDNEKLAVALSRGDDGSAIDAIVAALSENTPVKTGEKSGPQVNVSLSKGKEAGDEPAVVRDAKRRAEQFKAQYAGK